MIQYDEASKVFGSGQGAVRAVDRVSLSVPKGKTVVFLGPSGCGKTTLLRLTNRLEFLTSGSIRLGGREVARMNPVRLRRSMGYVIQQVGLFPNKTIAQNVAVVPRLQGWPADRIRRRVDQLLAMVNLEPADYQERFPGELSGGEQQRVGVARALAGDPEILLMDEPFGALDPINRERLQDEFLNLQTELKKTIVFVSHDIHEAVKMGDLVAVFQEGKLVQMDDPLTLLLKAKNRFVQDFVGSDRALKALGLIPVREVMAPAEAASAPLMETKVSQDTPLSQVLSAMLLHESDAAAVVDAEERVVGMVDLGRIRRSLLPLIGKGPEGARP